jgi:hypothetical protein
MKAFSHGCNVNFHETVREMYAHTLERVLQDFLNENSSVLFGTIDLEKTELRVYGTCQSASVNEKENRCSFSYVTPDGEQGTAEHPFEELLISHEAMFDIIDDTFGQVTAHVLYITFDRSSAGDELTYFFARRDGVTEPLACVAEFWPLVKELGRDVDFNMTGCTAYDLSQIRKSCDCDE